MAKTKYGKYIVYETPPGLYENYFREQYEKQLARGKVRPRSGKSMRLFQFSDDVLKGSFYLDVNWIGAGSVSEESLSTKPQIHDDWDEYLIFIGSDPDNPKDLGAEVELWLGDEKHTITKTCVVFIPRGLQHTPILFKRVDRPLIWITVGPTPRHIARFNRDPKWDKYLEPPAIPGQVL
jgi:hypothetical protein